MTQAEADSLLAQGHQPQAEAAYHQIATTSKGPPAAVAWLKLAACLITRKAFEQALEPLRRAIKALPNDAMAHGLLGEAQSALGRSADAARSYAEAVRLSPTDERMLINLADALNHLGKYNEATAYLKRANTLRPGNRMILKAWTQSAATGGTPAEALEAALSYARLPIGGDGEFAVATESKARALGNAHLRNGQARQAIVELLTAHQALPNDPEIRHSLGVAHLMAGEYQRGFELWQSRIEVAKRAGMSPPAGLGPAWNGEDLHGKTIYVATEQGVGDAIQFARYLPEIARRGGHVIVGCSEPVRAMMAGVEGVRETCDLHHPPDHDVSAWMLDLPLLLHVTERLNEFTSPYIFPNARSREALQKLLNSWGISETKRRIGLCWTGNPRQPVNARRAIDPALLAPLTGERGVEWVSVVKTHLPGTKTPKGVVDVMEQVGDFADTAALLDLMDLVITTDTSVAHLAGAMGKEVWVLLHSPGAHWMWGQTGEVTPWYPTARLFRQAAYGDWKELISRVKGELERIVAK